MERITHYHKETPERIKQTTDTALLKRFRVRVWYGDTKTGKAWNEENDVTGYIRRSTGALPIPLLVHNSRCSGGSVLLEHRIIRIDDISTRITVYVHKKFDAGLWTVEKNDMNGYAEIALCNGKIHARFKKLGQAKRYCQFMIGERYNK